MLEIADFRRFSVHLDWFRFSTDFGVNVADVLPMHPAFAHTGEILTPLPNYDTVVALRCCRVDWHSERPEQRTLFTMTGQDLENMRTLGCTDETMLREVATYPAINITRMDIAIDTTDTRISPKGAARDFTSGKLQTRARTISEITKRDKEGGYAGHTVYIGSRTSDQFLRIYDKAAESGQSGHLTRVELELKGHKAYEAMHTILRTDNTFGALAAFSRFFSWANAGWQDIVSQSAVKVARLAENKKSGYDRWLNEVALPAIERALIRGNEHITRRVQLAITGPDFQD